MALPRSIQAQVEQADATLAAINAPEGDTPPAKLAADPPESTNEQSPQPQETATAPAPAAPPAQPAPQNDVWEQRYKTLQGVFNREVPTLQGQVKDLKAQLEQAVARLNAASEKAEKPEQPTKPAADPQDVENFGSDLVEMVQRVAERMFGGTARNFQEQAARFESRLAELEKALQGTSQAVAMTAEQAFFDRLTKLVPNWEEVNANEAFLAWLGEVDPVYGQPRQAALNHAQQTLNSDRAAAVFRAFLGAVPQAPKASAVDKQVSPKGAATAAPAPAEKPILTQQQVVEFYAA